ncbi:cytochrome c biogenesis protein CcdA, partial [Streptomyces sp. NPDC052127]|uniref:cytochrome c biogenesis protein CcdA n=1 Tax=Streptomyces sp. NPDC052127 TaxID=3155679 RepID=UPI00341DAA71
MLVATTRAATVTPSASRPTRRERPIALLGGLVSFFSPCVLPLVPGYLSYVTGVA